MKKFLRNFGLTDKESEVFLVLLELGAQPISTVAKRCGIPRSTMYLILDRLKESGLSEFFQRRGITFVKPIAVEDVGELLRKKQQNVEKQIDVFQEKLPEFKKIENTLSIAPKIQLYEGVEEVEKMYQKIMKLDGYSAYFNPASLKKILPKYFYDLPEEYIKKKVFAREIMVDCPEAREYKSVHASKYYQFKILPKNSVFFSDMIITKHRMFLMSYGSENQICGTEIYDKSLAESQMTIYNTLWEKL